MTDDAMQLTDVEYFEKMVLAKALKHPEQRKKLKLSAEHFENKKHQVLYQKLIGDSKITAEDLLTESVKNPERFGNYNFIRTISNFPTATEKGIINDQYQVYDFYKKRVLAEKISEYQESPSSDLALSISRTVEELEKYDIKGTDDKMNTVIEIMDDLYGVNKRTIIKTGFDDLDNIISGFEPQQLNVIAARPSMGENLPLTSAMV